MQIIFNGTSLIWDRPLSEGAEGGSEEPRTALDYVQKRFQETYIKKSDKKLEHCD